MRESRRAPSEKEISRRSERWGFWALVVGIASMVVGIAMAIWSVHRSEQLTIASGALDKPQPHLYIGDIKVEGPLRLYVAAPFPDKSLTIIQLPLTVRNDGNKTTKGMELLVREPAFIAVDNDFVEAKVETSLPISIAPERHFSKSGNYAYTSFALPDMHPGQAFEISEPVRARDSHLVQDLRVVSKDGVPVSFTLSMDLGLSITVSIAGEDLHPTDYDLELLGVKASSQEEMVSAFEQEIFKEKEIYRNKMGFWRYTLESLTPLHKRAVLIYPDLQIINGDDRMSVFLPKGTLVTKDASYTMP